MKKQENVNRKPGEAASYFAGEIEIDGKLTRVLFTEHELLRPVSRAIKQPEDFENQTNKPGVFSMIKKLFVAIAVVFFIAGCSHNSVQYSDGLGFETTFRPDSGNFGFVFRYGKILSAVLRENSEVEMTGDGQGGSTGENAASASSSGSVKVKIGKQITGYYVDAINAGASEEKLNKYLDSGNDRKSDENKNQELEVKDGEL